MDQPQGARRLGVDRRAVDLPELVDLPVVLVLQLDLGDRLRADLDEVNRAAAAAEDVADAPDGEAHDQQREQDLEDEFRGFGAERGEHGGPDLTTGEADADRKSVV